MDARPHRIRKATLALSACVLLGIAAVLPAAAQDADLCSLLTPDDVSASIPGTYVAPMGMEGTCQWGGTTTSGGGVIVIAYLVPGSSADMPGAEVIDIDGHRGFSSSDSAMPVPTRVVGVEIGGELLVLSVSVDDAAVDLPAVAKALASTAVERFQPSASLAPSSPPTGADPTPEGPAASAAAASTSPAVGGSVCDLATPQEVAAAAGIDVELNVQDLEVACSWDALTDDGFVLVYATRQDPAVFDMVLQSLGAEEIDGPGEQDWWASSLASLFSRQGDLLLQVSYTSSEASDEDQVKATSIAIMEALLAS